MKIDNLSGTYTIFGINQDEDLGTYREILFVIKKLEDETRVYIT